MRRMRTLLTSSVHHNITSRNHRHHRKRIRSNSAVPHLLKFLLCYRSISSSSTSSSTRGVVNGLNLAIITGTTRTSGPPRPILGPRVAEYISNLLKERNNEVSIVNPNDFELLQKPHFCYAQSQVPSKLQEVYEVLNGADAYVCITPEYNHAPSPALLNVLNHYGSSVFSFKPSAIVSYSAGQWGGTRAAIGLRPILSEVGCIPVSAMIHIPKAQDVLDENGNVIIIDGDGDGKSSENQWKQYCNRCFSQLEWWGTAAKEHRQKIDPFVESSSFQKDPSEPNAP